MQFKVDWNDLVVAEVGDSSGVANRADPTQWDKLEITLFSHWRLRYPLIEMDITSCFGEVIANVRVYGHGLFISSAINSKLHPIVLAIYEQYLDRKEAELHGHPGCPCHMCGGECSYCDGGHGFD